MLDIISQCIYEGYKENITTDVFSLKENSKSAKCREAKFKKTGKVLVYKFDKIPKKNRSNLVDRLPFFNDVPRLKAVCDFVLFYTKSSKKLFIVLCNLKSGCTGNNQDQLKSGEIFVNYIIDNLKRIYPDNFGDTEVYKYSVIFSSKVLYKGSTNPKNYDSSKPRNFVSNSDQIDTCDLDNICRH